MKRHLKQCLVLFCCMALVMTAASCSSQKNAVQTTGSTSAVQQSSETQQKALEPITLKIYTRDSGYCKPGIQDGEFGKYIQERFGITMDITPAQMVPDYPQKLAAMVAAGDLPDIIWAGDNDVNLPKILVESGSVIPLDELIQTNGKDIQKEFAATLAYSKKYQNYGKGEKIYFVRWGVGAAEAPLLPSYGNWIRWDLYKQLGYPKYETEDDLINILEGMIKLEPKTPAGQKTYAIGINTDWGMACQVVVMTEQGMTGMGNYGDVMFHYQTGEIKRGFFTDKNSALYKNFKFYNTLQRKGLLDPDSFTQKWSGCEEKYKAGRYMLALYDWMVPTLKDIPNAKYLPLPPAKDIDYYPLSSPSPLGMGGFCYTISKNCKYPERAMDWLNFFSSYEGSMLYYNGIEGKHWDMVDGVPTLKPEIQDMLTSGDAEKIKTIGIQFMNWVGHPLGSFNPNINTINDFRYSPAGLAKLFDDGIKDYCAKYGVKKPIDVFKNASNIKYTEQNQNLMSFVSTDIPQEVKDIKTTVENYSINNWPKMVLAKTDAEFDKEVDKFIADIKAMNVDKMSDWYEDQIKKSVQQLNELTKGN